MSPIRVVLADDHLVVRAGIRVVMQSIPDVSVVAECGDGREVVALTAAHQPDVVFMDISMPTMSGLEATEHIKRDYPKTQVVILSIHGHEEYVLQALRAGASGYLLKDADELEMERALNSALADQTYISPSVSGHLSDYLYRVGNDAELLGALTERQRQILQLLAEGCTVREVAIRLDISPKTVETHKSRLMERLEIYDIPGLTRFAVRSGLVTLT